MKILSVIVTALLLSQTVFAQITPKPELTLPCDGMLGYFDYVLGQALLETNKDSLLIIIARSGSGEKPTINRQRLKSFEYYSTGFRPFPKDRMVLAEGEKRNGLGKLEFYIGGKLTDELFFTKKQYACVSCCPSEFIK